MNYAPLWFLGQMIAGLSLFVLGSFSADKGKKFYYPLAIVGVGGLCLGQVLRVRPDISFAWLPGRYFIYLEATLFALFAILFFAIVSRIHPGKLVRHGTRLLCGALGLYIIVYSRWQIQMVEPCRRQQKIDGVYIQSSSSTCGPAAGATLLNHLGIASTESEMARLTHTTGAGTSLLRIAVALENKIGKAGWQVNIVCTDWKGLQKLPFPCIVDTRYQLLVNHVVVVFRIEPQSIVIGDSLSGREYWSYAKFRERWNGYAIVVSLCR